jgi:hypothetical protein
MGGSWEKIRWQSSIDARETAAAALGRCAAPACALIPPTTDLSEKKRVDHRVSTPRGPWQVLSRRLRNAAGKYRRFNECARKEEEKSCKAKDISSRITRCTAAEDCAQHQAHMACFE